MEQKPLCVHLRDAEVEIGAAISNISNKHGLDYCLLEMILYKFYQQVLSAKNSEIAEAIANSENNLKED